MENCETRTEAYKIKYDSPKTRTEAIRRYCSRNIRHITGNPNFHETIAYREGQIEADLMEHEKTK